MSAADEDIAMKETWSFLVKLRKDSSYYGDKARDLLKHFPLGGDLAEAAKRYAPELLGKTEREADQLAHEVAREAARADAAETRLLARQTGAIPDYLNIP